jgi:uncharacterized protein YqhQ
MSENKSCAFRTSIGGQALIEGVMMRGPEKQAIVVRDQEGNLVEKVEDLKFIKDRYPILGWPLIRGAVNFMAAMVNGVKALMYSAEFYPEEESMQPSKFELWLEKHLSSKALESAIIALAVVLGIGLSLFLFMVMPTFVTGGVLHFFPGAPLWVRNVLEGLLKVAIFLVYLIFCSKQKDIQRVFQYHGAEHKTIFCYEAGLPLTVENVRVQGRHHPRQFDAPIPLVLHESALNQRKQKHGKINQLHMFPDRFIHRGKQPGNPAFSAPVIQKMQQCPGNRGKQKSGNLPAGYGMLHGRSLLCLS